MSNKYPGKCHACGCEVAANQGVYEFTQSYRRHSRGKLWCQACYDRSDNSSYEDRCCGDRAYEDRCAEACGY